MSLGTIKLPPLGLVRSIAIAPNFEYLQGALLLRPSVPRGSLNFPLPSRELLRNPINKAHEFSIYFYYPPPTRRQTASTIRTGCFIEIYSPASGVLAN